MREHHRVHGTGLRSRIAEDRGSATAEYAVVILAGVAREGQD